MSDKIYKVIVQGISQDLSTATGNYDDVIDYGAITVEELWKIWQRFIHVQPFPHVEDNDNCPANINIEGPYGAYLFETNGDGSTVFLHDYGGVELTTKQAYQYVIGHSDPVVLATQETKSGAQNVYKQQKVVMLQPEGPGTARRWFGNILATLSVFFGLVFAAASVIEGKEGMLINIIVAVIFLAFFAWLAWFSRRVIGGVKKAGDGQTDSQESSGVAQGIMMANMMDMDDSPDIDTDIDVDAGGFD